jgi:hypothetical protein
MVGLSIRTIVRPDIGQCHSLAEYLEAIKQQREAEEAGGMDANSLSDLNALIRALSSGASNRKWISDDTMLPCCKRLSTIYGM